MNKNEIMNSISRTFHRVGFQLKKHSPEILVAVGVTGTVVSAVMACKATTKIDAILNEAKDTIDNIHEVVEDPKMKDQYTVEDSKKDLTIVYAQTGLKLVKLYGPAIVVGAASIGCILTSHNIIRKRNIALAAAYATVDSSFKEYRNRVVERFGKDLDRELRYNVRAKEVEETVVDENGKETVVKKTIQVADDPNTYSDYARVFDDGCKGWSKDPEYNFVFLKQTQNYANDKLKARGHLFLNEVYEMLGIPKTRAGQSVGWVYDEKNPNLDNYVDFGIFDVHRAKVRDFINGYERTIILDFNVDGNILDLIY